jgi:hypothetical protein
MQASTGRPIEHKSPPTNIVIVGGGPIGLIQAFGLKKLNKDLKVTVLEKYDEYQRKHTLIMQPASLEAVMEATNTQSDPDLSTLLKRLKQDPHIRTNELETLFKELAKKNGVDIVREEVKADTAKEQLSRYQPDMIIGADGTHSVTNQALFPPNNQVKVEFDYVLQCRYEVKSKTPVEPLSSAHFYDTMSRHGIVASEYIGRHEKDGSTPVTMQMMISKEAFYKLKSATSKHPITPFKASEKHAAPVAPDAKELSDLSLNDLPEDEQNFLWRYISARLESSAEGRHAIDRNSVRISVNEAPATYAKQPNATVTLAADSKEAIPVLLAGDASLGLSYFKGLNAGLLSTAKFFTLFAPFIRSGQLRQSPALTNTMAAYTDWFVNDFAPKKVMEVESYSTWHIRFFMWLMKWAQALRNASARDEILAEDIAADYFRLMGEDPSQKHDLHGPILYPHRNHSLVKLAQFSYVPITYTLKRIGKLFVDYTKPYKSTNHFIQDLKQPLAGIANAFVGVSKLLYGMFTFNKGYLADGFFSSIRGAIELATTPLAWTVKPLVRFVITCATGKPKIENNPGMRRVAAQGLSLLNSLEKPGEINALERYKLFNISHDLHRKFKKAYSRGQESKNETGMAEQSAFAVIRTDLEHARPEQFLKHFSLFTPPPANAMPLKIDSTPCPSFAKKA